MVVVGLYVFVGNSGLLSFGHISFMCLGAYMTAWLTIPPMMKIGHAEGAAGVGAAHAVADVGRHADLGDIRGPCSRSSSARHHAVVRHRRLDRHLRAARRHQQRLFELGLGDGRARFHCRHPAQHETSGSDRWAPRSPSPSPISTRFRAQGLALRATRDEAVAASASGIDMVRERLVAFVVSAFIIGLAGALYAHFLSIVIPARSTCAPPSSPCRCWWWAA